MKSSFEHTLLQMEKADEQAGAIAEERAEAALDDGVVRSFDDVKELWTPILLDPRPDNLKQTMTLRKKLDVEIQEGVQDLSTEGSDASNLSPDVVLPELNVTGSDEWEEMESPLAELALQHKLAEGGMGRLYVADQVSLRREVVVKMALPGENAEETSERLLQESWLTGLLEHPNIVPVYQLGKDRKGQPMLVMKRIEGLPWHDILHENAQAPNHQEGQKPTLEWHIQTLIQACNAVEFAHSKNIIHRDLKPENIMIGGFGEVYVLDWGIAVSLAESDRGKMPLAREAQGVAGTPAYMAPEMARGNSEALGPQTDVYLLGALLHELITGAPPHSKPTLLESLFSIYRSEPQEYAPSVPNLLVQICHKAMKAVPEERYESVAAFRQALQNYLLHRESLNLSTRSKQDLNSLTERLYDTTTKLDEQELYNQFGRCHFGLQHALEIWPENQEAKDLLYQLLLTMFEYEMQQENTKAAARWLAEFAEPQPELRTRLNELQESLDKKREHLKSLETLAYETDLRIGANARKGIALIIGAIWGIFPLCLYLAESLKWYKPDHTDFIAMNLIFAVVLAISTYLGRKSLLRNKANRQVIQLLSLLVIVLLVQRIVVLSLELPFRQTAVLEFVLFFKFIGLFGIFYDRRMFYPASLYLLALSSALFWPAYLFLYMATAHFFGMITLGWLWSSDEFLKNETAEASRSMG